MKGSLQARATDGESGFIGAKARLCYDSRRKGKCISKCGRSAGEVSLSLNDFRATGGFCKFVTACRGT